MTYADNIFKENIENILENGVFSENARPKYKDGNEANSKYVTGSFATYDLSKGQFPITTLRRIPIKSAIKELYWIYSLNSNSLDVLENELGVTYWNDWDIGDRTIGVRYGQTVKKYDIMNRLLKGLEENPWNRRNVINLWQYEDFDESAGILPCAFQTMFDVRREADGQIYLDATLTQRSNDMLVAHHINAMQYVALQMMIAKHFSWKVGKFFYFVNNLHIYDNQFDQARELLYRASTQALLESVEQVPQPRLVLNVPDGTNFYDIKPEDFELVDYEPQTPQLKFDLAI